VAISGAGPPAVIEERWKPSEKRLWCRRGGEALRDQRRLRTSHHVVRDERQHDSEKNPARESSVQQREIDKAPHLHRDRPEEIYPLAPDAIREIPGKRDHHERAADRASCATPSPRR